MDYRTNSKLRWFSCLYFLIFFLLCLGTASANTETFQFRIPSTGKDLSLFTNSLDALPNSYQIIDLTGKTPEFDHNIKINVTNEIVNGGPIVLKLKHNPAALGSRGGLYTLKVCWSAISPIAYKSDSFTSLTVDEETTYIMFNFYWDARPVDPKNSNIGETSRNSEYFINCSVSRVILGVLPSDLVPIVRYILIVLVSLYLINRYVVNFFEFFCYRV